MQALLERLQQSYRLTIKSIHLPTPGFVLEEVKSGKAVGSNDFTFSSNSLKAPRPSPQTNFLLHEMLHHSRTSLLQ
jgi:hypothetical protein